MWPAKHVVSFWRKFSAVGYIAISIKTEVCWLFVRSLVQWNQGNHQYMCSLDNVNLLSNPRKNGLSNAKGFAQELSTGHLWKGDSGCKVSHCTCQLCLFSLKHRFPFHTEEWVMPIKCPEYVHNNWYFSLWCQACTDGRLYFESWWLCFSPSDTVPRRSMPTISAGPVQPEHRICIPPHVGVPETYIMDIMPQSLFWGKGIKIWHGTNLGTISFLRKSGQY